MRSWHVLCRNPQPRLCFFTFSVFYPLKHLNSAIPTMISCSLDVISSQGNSDLPKSICIDAQCRCSPPIPLISESSSSFSHACTSYIPGQSFHPFMTTQVFALASRISHQMDAFAFQYKYSYFPLFPAACTTDRFPIRSWQQDKIAACSSSFNSA